MNVASLAMMFDLLDVVATWSCPILLLMIVFVPIIILFNRNSELKRRLDVQEHKQMQQEQRTEQLEQKMATGLPPVEVTPVTDPPPPAEDKPPIIVKAPLVETESPPAPVPVPTSDVADSERVPEPSSIELPELPPLVTSAEKEPEPQPAPVELPELASTPLIQSDSDETGPQSIEAPPIEPEVTMTPKASLEERVGKVWLVRVGVVLVLTGLAYLANMGYVGLRDSAEHKHLIPYINAALLYLVSFGMLGGGLFLHKRFENLKNFGEVLTGGGMAAVYFSTYALHFVDAPVLGLVSSPVAAGAMLAAWAAFIIVLATRRYSELMAMFAVAGAYYASYVPLIHNPEAGNVTFTFASNIALGIAAVFFVLRNRWANLSFLALVTSYFGFAYWRFQHAVGGTMEFWQDSLFLIVYWLIFTAAGFLSRNEQLTPTKRSTFVNLNNGACFALITISLLQVPELRASYWVLPLVFGFLILGLYTVARRWMAEEKLLGEILLAKAATLITLAIMTLESADQFRALLLGAEAITILYFGMRTENAALRWASSVIAGVGAIFVSYEIVETFVQFKGAYFAPTLRLGLLFGVLMLGASAVAKFGNREKSAPVLAEIFTGLGMLSVITACLATLMDAYLPIGTLLLAALGLGALAGSQVARIRTLWIAGEIHLGVGILIWLTKAFSPSATLPTWQPWILLIIVLGAQLWRQHVNRSSEQGTFEKSASFIGNIGGSIAMGLVLLALSFQLVDFDLTQFSIPLAALGLAITVYALTVRDFTAAVLGAAFTLGAPLFFVAQIVLPGEVIGWKLALVPIIAAFAYGGAVDRLRDTVAERLGTTVGTQFILAAITQSLAILCGLAACLNYLPSDDLMWVLPLIGVLLSIVCLGFTLTPGLITAQAFILFAGALMPLKLLVESPSAALMFVPMIVILGMSHFLLHSTTLVQAEKHPLKTLAKFGTGTYFYYGWALAMAWGAKYVSGDYLFLLFTAVGVTHVILHQRRARLERLIVAGTFVAVGFLLFWLHTALHWSQARPLDAIPLFGMLGALCYLRAGTENKLPDWAHLIALLLLNFSLWQWTSRMVPGDYDVISWSVLAFILITMGLWSRERAHRLFGLAILLTAIGNVIVLTWTHLGGASRIITFIGMGLILIILGLLYHRFQDKMKDYL